MTRKRFQNEKGQLGRKREPGRGDDTYVLRLYITGATPNSTRAVKNIKSLCEEHLHGRYRLEVIDIYQQPVLAKGEQILAAPTLIKSLPLPIRRFIGDMSQKEKILLGFDLKLAKNSDYEDNDGPSGQKARF